MSENGQTIIEIAAKRSPATPTEVHTMAEYPSNMTSAVISPRLKASSQSLSVRPIGNDGLHTLASAISPSGLSHNPTWPLSVQTMPAQPQAHQHQQLQQHHQQHSQQPQQPLPHIQRPMPTPLDIGSYGGSNWNISPTHSTHTPVHQNAPSQYQRNVMPDSESLREGLSNRGQYDEPHSTSA
jgi:hypothetical protein